MKELPESVQNRLQELADTFLARLPGDLRALQAQIDQSQAGNQEALRGLRLGVHRLAGSAATFCFEQLGQEARRVEERVEQDLLREDQGPSQQTVEAFDAFLAMAREMLSEEPCAAGEDRADQTPQEAASPVEVETNRVVVLLGSVPGIPEDFAEQMAVFRFALLLVPEIDLLPEVCGLRLGDCPDTCRTMAVVASLEYFSEDVRRLQVISRLQKRYDQRLVFALVGKNDDFSSRLRSVRYGASMFLPVPLEMASFVERLDSAMRSDREDPYHILIIDDDPEQVSDTALILQEAGMVTSVVTDPSNIFRVLVEYRPELIVMDMYMPECTGAELTRIIRQNESFVGVPILYLSVEQDTGKQIEALCSGGDGFFVKPVIPEHFVTSIRVRASRTRAMRFYMERDSLTGLLNHTNLKEHLHQEVQRARRIGLSLTFVMIDLDHFKEVNDRYGHLAGDRVLKSLSRLLRERLRRSDTIGRYGGEEFGVILFDTDASWAETIMEEIRQDFSILRQSDGSREFMVTLSCGIADFPRFSSAAALNEAADRALYLAKEKGRNRTMIART
ncbi:response regulator receiver modulated diguanylate cyclase [Alkalispirochaeta americana]|uniref:diguanylate cyclase n=1 Tax=Alkalispirochaeta americana TaxID=159291 RepID=A0A1N6QRY3_9SPIO|nr:diguanylate cyclase [Alkalispirochaeta americana]SIQ19308.1 response regulator receiver modulated diguanylate cyclase [Alkalispirochaeta americana]